MPKFSKRPYNKTRRGRGARRYKRGFKAMGSTNKLYRNTVPRTLQIATRRNTKQILRFVANQTYSVNPGGDVGGLENVFLRFRCNSIYDINQGNQGNGALNANNTWKPQDPTKYGPTQSVINAEGWEDWQARYSHFTVLGSRIQVTYEPYGIAGSGTIQQVPSTVYINLAGNSSQISTGTEMSQINELPYNKRAGIVPDAVNSSTTGLISTGNKFGGVRLYHNYSTKSFEGVKDVMDNEQLKGAMLSAPEVPAENSFFTVGIRNTIPSTAANDRCPRGILRIKMEYITLLTEPTSTNQVQMPSHQSTFV